MQKFFQKTTFIFIAPVFLFVAAALPFRCNVSKDGGVFRSDDFGASWLQKTKLSPKQDIGRANVLSLAIDEVSPNVLYLGTHGDSVYKSLNEGEIWEQLSDKNNVLDSRAVVYDIEIDSKNPNFIFAAVFQNSLGRLLRSQDAGQSWQEGYVMSKNGATVATIEQDRRNQGFLYIGTSEGGLLKSADYGVSWQSLKWFDSGVLNIRIDPQDSQIIYVNTQNNGLQKTNDQGKTWQALEVGAKDFLGAKKVVDFLIDSRDSKILYAAAADGIFKSLDAGQSWQKLDILMPEGSGLISALAQDAQDSQVLYYTAGQVFYRTGNSGQTWTTFQIPSSRDVTIIKPDPISSNIIYVGVSE